MGEPSYEILQTSPPPTFLDTMGNFTDGNGTNTGATQLDPYMTLMYYRPAIAVIQRYITPVWYILGFPGNILSIFVWIQPRMRPSSGVYLTALALADLVFLLLHVPFELHTVWGITVLDHRVICEAFPIFFMTSQYLSPLLVLGFTVERYISICHPFQREKYCSTRRGLTVITLLLISVLCLNAIQGYFWAYQTTPDGGGYCSPRPEVLIGGITSLWQLWSLVTETLVFGIVPVCILVLNMLVIKEARRLSITEEKRLCLKKGHKTSSPSATTVMLLAVSFYLILTTLPVTVMYLLMLTFPNGDVTMTLEEAGSDPQWIRYFNYHTIKEVVNELCMSHYACNFYIYFATGKIFRQELQRLFYKTFCKEKAAQRLWDPEFQEFRSSMRSNYTVNTNANTNGAVAHL